MTTPDPYEGNIMDLTVKAMMFRLNPADPSSPDSITISKDVFNRLLSIADSAFHAGKPSNFGQSLTATMSEGIYTVCVDGGQFGKFTAEGRTLLEAIVLAHRAYGAKLESYIR